MVLSKEGHARCRSCRPSGVAVLVERPVGRPNEVQRSYAASPSQVGTAVPEAPSERRDTVVPQPD
jgi:hypothetical protein